MVLNAHADASTILDSLDGIFAHVGQNVILVVDGSAWPLYRDLQLPVAKINGFRHGVRKSPYRNVALGLKSAWEAYPNAGWFCYAEYDVLFTSDRFRRNLEIADKKDVWMLGNDGHVDDKRLPLIESLVGAKFPSTYYLLGCCQFFSWRFMEKLQEIDFFERFLFLTNQFSPGVFPAYEGYDISEHLYPTLCRYFGGAVGVFATWDHSKWHGAYRYFPMRWRPELDPETENFEEASIMHPLKKLSHPIREFHRERRKTCLLPHTIKPSA